MKTKISPTIVGAFVIGAMILAVVVLFSFGGVNFFEKPQRFLVYFDESVHGLDQGSQVKLRGVRVGRVIELTIRYDPQRNHSVVAVVCEFSKDVIVDDRGQPINVSDRAELETLVRRGLRARLEALSLATGMLFVGLDFRDPKESPPPPQPPESKYVVVPFIPSAIEEFQVSIAEILTDLKKIDFAGISKGLTAVLADIPKRLEGVDLKGVTEQWKKTGATIESLASGPEVKRTFDNLNGAIADLRATIAKLDSQLEPAGKEVQATLAEAKHTVQAFSDAANAAKAFIATQSGLGDELVDTLSHLNEAADSVRRLADFLERNPNSLLTGRKRPQ